MSVAQAADVIVRGLNAGLLAPNDRRNMFRQRVVGKSFLIRIFRCILAGFHAGQKSLISAPESRLHVDPSAVKSSSNAPGAIWIAVSKALQFLLKFTGEGGPFQALLIEEETKIGVGNVLSGIAIYPFCASRQVALSFSRTLATFSLLGMLL